MLLALRGQLAAVRGRPEQFRRSLAVPVLTTSFRTAS